MSDQGTPGAFFCSCGFESSSAAERVAHICNPRRARRPTGRAGELPIPVSNASASCPHGVAPVNEHGQTMLHQQSWFPRREHCREFALGMKWQRVDFLTREALLP